MRIYLFIIFFGFSFFIYPQCFDCGQNIGGHVEDYVVDIDKTTDGVVLTINPGQGWGRSIYKYDFNCNLIWTNEFQPDSGNPTSVMSFWNTSVDDVGNIYSTIKNNRGGIVVEGFQIERGNNLVKLNPNGTIAWVKKISDDTHLKRNVHTWGDNVFVSGLLDEGVGNDLGISVPDGFGTQYFLAKYDDLGNLINAYQFGNEINETFFDSQIDENGNIYLTGSTSTFENHVSNLYKISQQLQPIWTRELSNNPADRAFRPMTIYYNQTNKNLYVWNKYYRSANFYNQSIIADNCEVGSVILEISSEEGSLENFTVIENCGFYHPVGNGIGDIVQKSFMSHEEDNLYILSSFRGQLTLGGQTLTTSQNSYGVHDSDLILHKINLGDFSSEIILRSTGQRQYYAGNYRDLAGPILAIDNSVFLTSSFTSIPITINNKTINNNSGNNARDILFYKHLLDKEDLSGVVDFDNTCFSEPTTFSINGEFDSVTWDFDDLDSGTENTSISNNPSHIFTSTGVFKVTATIICGDETETIEIEVVINERPVANPVQDLRACEDSFNSQISSSFDTSNIESNIIGNQTGIAIRYFDGENNELPSPLPNPMTNSMLSTETITARVAFENNLTCYDEITFDLIVEPTPEIAQIEDLQACDDNDDGIASFDIRPIENYLLEGHSSLQVEFYRENGQLLPNPLPDLIINQIPNKETIRARIINLDSHCYNETSFNIVVNQLPMVDSLDTLIGCDDNQDGISEFFNTSEIERTILNGQTGLTISYFNQNGEELPSPLPNPLSNTIPFNENITVIVSNSITGCHKEIILPLQTSSKPNIEKPSDLFACDNGGGYAIFDTTHLEEEIIGIQSGLKIYYYDSQGNQLPSPLSSYFENTVPFNQTIYVKVEDENNPACFSETSFGLVVTTMPEIELETEYIICDLEPSISLKVSSEFSSYEWIYEDGTIISLTDSAEIIEAGNYTLKVVQMLNGINCESNFDFRLTRSALPKIREINKGSLGDNFIEILAVGNGEYEYSIDGVNFQDSNYFEDLFGGIYMAHLRDKNGCGEDSREVFILDYPKFFTPNADGINDYWQLEGIETLSNWEIFIFDRYGTFLSQLTPNNLKWNGLSNNRVLPSSDYWFIMNFEDGTSLSGHFSLKR